MPRLQVKIGPNRFQMGISHVNHSGELLQSDPFRKKLIFFPSFGCLPVAVSFLAVLR